MAGEMAMWGPQRFTADEFPSPAPPAPPPAARPRRVNIKRGMVSSSPESGSLQSRSGSKRLTWPPSRCGSSAPRVCRVCSVEPSTQESETLSATADSSSSSSADSASASRCCSMLSPPPADSLLRGRSEHEEERCNAHTHTRGERSSAVQCSGECGVVRYDTWPAPSWGAAPPMPPAPTIHFRITSKDDLRNPKHREVGSLYVHVPPRPLRCRIRRCRQKTLPAAIHIHNSVGEHRECVWTEPQRREGSVCTCFCSLASFEASAEGESRGEGAREEAGDGAIRA